MINSNDCNTQVIAISGASGAGKTTIIEQLSHTFNCPFLLFDHHTDKDTYPSNMKQWLESGADVSLFKTPKFVSALELLVETSTAPYIFIEEPFGKEREAMSAMIDIVVLLDQPLELCLARIIKRHTEHGAPNSLNSIASFLDKYEDHMREIYHTTVERVRSHSDLIINDVISIQQTSQRIIDWLNGKHHQITV